MAAKEQEQRKKDMRQGHVKALARKTAQKTKGGASDEDDLPKHLKPMR